MISKTVRIGREELQISGATLGEVIKVAKYYQEMAFRVPEDAYFVYRENDGGEFIELYSKRIGGKKKVSKYKEQKRPVEGVDYFIGIQTPWERYDSEKGVKEVMFDTVDYRTNELPENVQESGFEKNKWTKAEYVKKGKDYSWKPL